MTQLTTLSFYWDIASTDIKKRNGAAVALMTTLRQFQEQFQDANQEVSIEDTDEVSKDLHPDVSYALKRLTRGLTSSRLNAREGFAVCLTELYEILSESSMQPSHLISILHTSVEKYQVGGKGKEEREGLFAKIFGYNALIASGILKHATKEDIIVMIDGLLEISKKAYMRVIVCKSFIDLVWAVHEQSLFKELITPLVRFFTEIKETVEFVWVVLELQSRIQFPWPNVLPDWKKSNLLHFKNLGKLISLLKNAAYLDAKIHPVFSSLVSAMQTSTDDEITVWQFWTEIEAAFFNSTHERKSVAFQLFELISDQYSSVSRLCTPIFLKCLINSLSNKDTYLHKQANRIVLSLNPGTENCRSKG
jgi:DNA polymerase phi